MEVFGLGLKGSIWRIAEEVEGLVFLLNLIEDFLVLMVWPDHEQYVSRQALMLAASRREALPNSSRSSAKRRWFIAEESLAIFIPLIFPSLSSLSNNLESNSEPMMKRKGERGSPCLKPLEGEKRPKGLPFRRMEKEGEEMQVWIHYSQVS
jgi:hypothetical protein